MITPPLSPVFQSVTLAVTSTLMPFSGSGSGSGIGVRLWGRTRIGTWIRVGIRRRVRRWFRVGCWLRIVRNLKGYFHLIGTSPFRTSFGEIDREILEYLVICRIAIHIQYQIERQLRFRLYQDIAGQHHRAVRDRKTTRSRIGIDHNRGTLPDRFHSARSQTDTWPVLPCR